MAQTNKQLSVRLNGRPVGVLEQDSSGKMSFQYLLDASQSLSFSLPLQGGVFEHKVCQAYFGGLLPESGQARNIIARKYNVNPNNDFSLLKAIGHDCAGAVSFHKMDDPLEKIGYVKLEGVPLSENKLAGYIKELPQKPLFMGVNDLRLSLAGVQNKAAVCVIDDKICLPIEGCPTTHIVKPAIEGFKDTIENEYLCLKVAKIVGIDVPEVEIKHAGDVKYLLIKRYDREAGQDGLIKRIHQEDFCQALGVAPAYKYQSEGGPGFKECFDLMKKMSMPALDRNRLAERAVFNFLIGNNDAHGKNFSILHYETGFTKLSPMYDVLCTQVYDLADKMAMKIGGHYEHSVIFPRHLEKLCDEIGYSYFQFKKNIIRQVEKLPEALRSEIENLKLLKLSYSLSENIMRRVDANCDIIQKKIIGVLN